MKEDGEKGEKESIIEKEREKASIKME